MTIKKFFVEQRPNGGYAVRRADSQRASAILPTQAEAIQKAKAMNPGTSPNIERVRNTQVGGRDKWRKP